MILMGSYEASEKGFYICMPARRPYTQGQREAFMPSGTLQCSKQSFSVSHHMIS
jgi:hypothetical protein